MHAQLLTSSAGSHQTHDLVMQPPMAPAIFTVTADERQEIMHLAKLLKKTYGTYENAEYISTLHLHAFKALPGRIAKIVSKLGSDFSTQQYGAIVLRGLVEVNQEAL